jgi:putative heme-binding domain-containing protein
VVRKALHDPEESVRQAAAHSAGLWRDPDAVDGLRKLVLEDAGHNARAAAEALGRIGQAGATVALAEALGRVDPADRVLEHSLTYALIEINDGKLPAVRPANANAARALLTALDQTGPGELTAKRVATELTATDARLRETAWWIAGRHPEWGEELAGFFRERLGARDATPGQREELIGRLTKFAQAKAVQELLASRLSGDTPAGERRLVLQAMSRANLKEAPRLWVEGVARLLEARTQVAEAVAAARTLRLPASGASALGTPLLRVADDEKLADGVRIAALEAVPGGLSKVSAAQFKLLLGRLGPDQPVAERALAATVLAKAKLDAGQFLALAETYRTLGPMEADRLLEAFSRSTDEKVGKAFLAALKESPARGSLRVEAIRQQLAKYPAAVHRQAEELYSQLDADAGKQKERLEKMLASLTGGDIRRGQKVFHNPKAACAACHAIGYLGGKIGPDLTKIGGIRTERDLLEAIVFPSASLVRSYEPILVATRDGKTHNGLLRQESPDEVVLVTGADQEVRLARRDIEEIQPGKVSVMPSGLDQQLTAQDLADLVAFLKACR